MSNDSSEAFRAIPNDSEQFGKVPQSSESLRTLRNDSDPRQTHTLTVREVARLFEAAGVARTERSITNWCQPNKTGIARLDAYLDPNEHKYFITRESVELAIQEEQAREKQSGSSDRSTDQPESTNTNRVGGADEVGSVEIKALEQEILDLKITNRGKDYFIEQLQKEREVFGEERQRYVEDLMRFNRRVGELETKLRLIEAPDAAQSG